MPSIYNYNKLATACKNSPAELARFGLLEMVSIAELVALISRHGRVYTSLNTSKPISQVAPAAAQYF